jgi:flagellar hook assembly protein FlgD
VVNGKDGSETYDGTNSVWFSPALGTASYMYASDKPTGHIVVARGPVEFFEKAVNPGRPQMFHTSETVQLSPYEIIFHANRTAQVTVQIISTNIGKCMGVAAPAGTVCRTITQTLGSSVCGGTPPPAGYHYPTECSGIYDAIPNKVFWDGKDENGDYVKRDAYEVRFIGDIYPRAVPPTMDATVESLVVNVNNFQVFDLNIWDVSPTNQGEGRFAYQVSVPMKVAIQIFKPGTRINNVSDGTLSDPACPAGVGSCTAVAEQDVKNVLVKAIIGVRPQKIALEDPWDGTDYAGQKVPDGAYPFRYVTVLDGYDMDSVDGHIKTAGLMPGNEYTALVQDKVADWKNFVNLDIINVANGDSWYADIDWKSNQVTTFFPNPLRKEKGEFEITKLPAPGNVTIKIYNIAGDLVREGGYQCYNARAERQTLEQWNNMGLQPDIGSGAPGYALASGNFALRCEWDRTNDHGKKVARGLYYAIMELTPTQGTIQGNTKKSQKVVKILIP